MARHGTQFGQRSDRSLDDRQAYVARHAVRRRSLTQRLANASIVAGVAMLFLTRVAVVSHGGRIGRRR